MILILIDNRRGIITSILPFSRVIRVVWTGAPRVHVPSTIQLARHTVVDVALRLEKRGAWLVWQQRIAVHIEMHLLELLIPHNVDGFLCAFEVEFKLSVLLIQFQTLGKRGQQCASLFGRVVSAALGHHRGACLTLVPNKRVISWVWFLKVFRYAACVTWPWRHLIEKPKWGIFHRPLS